ncbi:MAG: hypothetical protein ACK4L7_07895 [Flavobacteriales bacterium]
MYDDSRDLIAGVEQGRTLVAAAASDSVLVSERAIGRLVRHARAHGVDHVAPAGEDLFLPRVSAHAGSVMGGGRWLTGWMDARFVSDRLPTVPAVSCDVLVAHDLDWADAALERQVRVAKVLVIGPRVRWAACRRLRAWAAAAGARVHEVSRHGAFILRRGEL